MNLTEIDIRKKYRYSSLSYVFDVYMECELRANVTQESFNGLAPGEFRFDYKSWEDRLGYSHKQMVRAIKELTIENIVIIQRERGKKGVSSKYFLARFEEQKKEQNEEQKREQKKASNIKALESGEEQKEEQKQEQKRIHSSQHNNLNIISQHNNNIYSLIFENWISKNIKKHRSLTNDIKNAIDRTLKEYSQDQLIEAINNYSVMYNDKSYKWCNYQWGLHEFLLRKDKDGIRQLGLFLNDGSKYVNYLKNKKIERTSNKQVNSEELEEWANE